LTQPQVVADRVGAYVQAYTLYSSVRPFGVSTIVGGLDGAGPQLHIIEPSGVSYGYHGAAVGKGRTLAKTELEKLNLAELSTREAVFEAARMYVRVTQTLWAIILTAATQHPLGTRGLEGEGL
jgi:20S proteasome subunit alpha 7